MTQGLLRKNNLFDLTVPNKALQNLGLNPADYEQIKGLHSQETRTNLLRWSQSFDNVAWSATSSNGTVSIQDNAVLAPDGSLTANRLQSTGSNFALFQGIAKPASAIQYATSIFAKGNVSELRVGLFDSGSNNSARFFVNLTTGLVTADILLVGSFLAASGFIVPLDNDWYRVGITALSNTATTITSRFSSGTIATNVSVYLWGAQLEVGGFSTDYIPTTSVARTRFQSGISNREVQYIAGSAANYQNQLTSANASLSGITLDNAVSRSGDTIGGTWTNTGSVGAQQVVFSGGTPTASTCAVFTHQSGEGQFRLTASSVTANNGITVERLVDSGNTVVASGVVPTRRIPITIAGTTYFMEAG
jgi:hypothetical protein